MKIICISGKAQHGKDTSATIMKELLETDGKRVLIAHYGDLVKYVCRTFFGWDGNKDEKGRTILQYVGTDIVREQRPEFWVDFIVDILNLFKDEWDYVLIPDCRFPNEIERMKKEFTFASSLRITRDNFISPLSEEQQKHLSETSLDDYEFDFTIHNNGTLNDLKTMLRIYLGTADEFRRVE